jgi:spermidine synthase
VMRTAREDFGAGVTGARFHVGDGRMFLRDDGPWDAALLDVVSTEVMPEHLCTVEFFRELKARLRPGGVILMNTVGRPGGRVLGSFGKTLAAVFAHRLAYTAHPEPESTNVVWFASDSPLELPEDSRLGYADRAYDAGAAGVVLTDDYNPVNHWNASVGLALRRNLHREFGRGVFEAR